MRQQQKILYDTIVGARSGDGALLMDAPFLTFGEVLECVREIVKVLAADYGEIPANTLQTWLKARLSIQADRPTRNRLYSGMDLVRIASVYYLAHVTKVDIGLAIHMADFGMTELARDSRRFAPEAFREFHPAGCIIARPAHMPGEWTIGFAGDPDDPKDPTLLHKHLMIAGCSTVFNFALVVGLTAPILNDKWNAKATWLRSVIEREIAKRKGNR
jgi:hypothetical protein